MLFSRTTLKNTFQNSSWVIASKLVIFVLSFGLMTALANLLNKETVGLYNYIIAALSIISIATLPGMNTALIRSVSRGNEGGYSSMARKRIGYGILGSLISVLFALWYFIHGNTVLGALFLVGAVFIPFTDTLNELAIYYWVGKKEYKKSALTAILYQLLFTLPSIAVLFFTKRIEYIVGSFLFFQALAGYLTYKRTRVQNTVSDPNDERFGMHLTLMQGFRIIGVHSDKIITWYLLGPVSVALYTFASIPITKLEQLIPIEQIALPVLSTKGYSPEQKKALLKKTGMLFVLIIPTVAALYLVAPFLYAVLFPSFLDSIALFRMLLVVLLCSPLLLLRTALTAWQKQRQLYTLETLSPLIKIGFILVFGSMFGIIGIIVGVCASKVVDSLITAFLFLKA